MIITNSTKIASGKPYPTTGKLSDENQAIEETDTSSKEARKSRDSISEILTMDQCIHGFKNTELAILLWLARCTETGKGHFIAQVNSTYGNNND